MAAQSKATFLNEIHTLLKKRYKPKPERASKLSVLEAVVYGMAHDGTTREQANQALSRFKDDFYDWNEVRVSTIDEVQGALAGLPDPEPRAQKIRRFLRQLFEKTYAFNLEALTKKPLKDSLKTLSEYEAFASDYVEATVTQLALGGHAIPVDVPARRALQRLGIADQDTDIPALRALLERAVPKNRGVEFVDLIEELAHDTCVEGEPDCPRCELRKVCPTGLARKDEAATAAKSAASKARATAKAPHTHADATPPKGLAKAGDKAKEPAKPPAVKEGSARPLPSKTAAPVPIPAPLPPVATPVPSAKDAHKAPKASKGRPGSPKSGL